MKMGENLTKRLNYGTIMVLLLKKQGEIFKMKSYLYKMMTIIFILSSCIIIYKKNTQERILYQNYIKNNIYESNIPKSRYEEPIVYDRVK